jgi:betaine reductase
MANAAVKACSNCLVHVPEIAFHYGNTPYMERKAKPDSEFLAGLPKAVQAYDEACRYAPNLAFVGAISIDELEVKAQPWLQNLEPTPVRDGAFGEIMPEDEFLGLMDFCDVFDLIWLTEDFAAQIKLKLESRNFWTVEQLARLEKGHPPAELTLEIKAHAALPLYFEGKLAGCCRRGHETDENLSAHVLLENIASKATSVLALMHLLKTSGFKASDVDFLVECSEEAIGDMNQRGGGNLAKAVAEIAGCQNASGFDVRAFCAGPTAAIITSASMVAAGARKNVVVLAGGAVPKLYMNARDHVKKGLPGLENCLGSMAVLLTPEDGETPVIRLDSLGKHSVGTGASPQAVTTALAWEPLERLGLTLTDVDKYAPELHNAEITLPAGAGNVPEANYKMIAALGVMKKQLERADINGFVKKHGLPGFAPTQGHIPSGVPYMGHALAAMKIGALKRVMIIGKGSLFLGRLTNLADGASFLMEKMPAGASSMRTDITAKDVEDVVLEALGNLAATLTR